MRGQAVEVGRGGSREAAVSVRSRTAASTLLDELERAGVERVFGYPGGAVLPLYDALVDSPIEHVLVRHEQGAAMAADGYARASGRLGVCFATSGPGATNLLTGIAGAFADSIPMLAITGQVPSQMMGTDAFQEVDVLGMTMPIVKHSYLVRDPQELASVVREAIALATGGRPGPVVIDVPKDVLAAAVSGWRPQLRPPVRQELTLDEEQLECAVGLLAAASRPVMYLGGGVSLAGATESCRELLRRLEIPTVCTLKAIGTMPSKETLGMLGMHGTVAANRAVQGCDLLICVGARFDDRVTGKLAAFAPNARVIHFDIDPAEVGKRRMVQAQLIGHLSETLVAFDRATEGLQLRIDPWRERCGHWRRESEASEEKKRNHDCLEGPDVIRSLFDVLPSRSVVTCDVGQHQMWVAQYGRFGHPSDHLSHGGLGAMGYGLPAAIGAQFARPDACVVNVSGDGSFLMNVQELATAKRYGLPVKVIVMDNQCLGMVRQWQDLFQKQRYSEVDLADNPDFVEVAEAFRVPAERVTHPSQLEDALVRLLTSRGPALLHVMLHRNTFVWPIVPPGASNGVMLQSEEVRHG